MVDERVGLWRDMVTLRAADERAVTLSRQGRIGAYPLYWGEEGVQAGALAALRRTDWLFPSYRQNAIAILRGQPPEQAWLYFRGDPQGFLDPAAYACASQSVPLATHLPHAVGWAWSRARRGADDVAVAFFGDGATSEGDFHEALNLAGVLKAPVVFLCTNNQWAISTPYASQTAAAAIVDKAVGYGVRGERVDGFDAVAVRDAVASAAALARAGDGPSLVEAFCYRIRGHATADDPSVYRDEAESRRWEEREPIGRLERTLVTEGALPEAAAEAGRADAHATMAEAARRLDAVAPADATSMTADVLAEPTPVLAGQLEEALR